MRSKEHAHDYRYFPEPDLVPLRISDGWRERVRAAMPELPSVKRARFVADYKLPEYDANWLTADRAVSEYFERTAAVAGDPKAAANWVMGDLAGALKAAGKDVSQSPVSAENLGKLIQLIRNGEINGKQAKEIFPDMFATGEPPSEITRRKGIKQVDEAAIDEIVLGTITAHPDQVKQYLAGKMAVVGFLVGKAMKQSQGQADPVKVRLLLEQKLKELPKP